MQRPFQTRFWSMIVVFWRVSFLSLCFAASIHIQGGDAAAITGASREISVHSSNTASSWFHGLTKRFEVGGPRRGIDSALLEPRDMRHSLPARRQVQAFPTDTDNSGNIMTDPTFNADEKPQGLSFGQLQQQQSQDQEHQTRAPLKVMIVGDSLSHGALGSWTWRYRFWQWTQEQHLDFKFVGPYNGTYSNEQNHTTIGEYAPDVDAAFLSNCFHFAHWGRSANQVKKTIKFVQEHYQADLMLVMLGFNDIAWQFFDGAGTLDNIHELLDIARGVTPNLKFAVANIPHRTFMGREDLVEYTNQFNNLLPGAISSWSTAESPIHLVDIVKSYNCTEEACPVGYDGLHPNKLGAYQLAEAFTQTLVNDFHLGASPLVVPHIPITPNMTDPFAGNLPEKPANGSVPFQPLPIGLPSSSAAPTEASSTVEVDATSTFDQLEQPTTTSITPSEDATSSLGQHEQQTSTSTTFSTLSTSSAGLEAITQPGKPIKTEDPLPAIATSSAGSVPSVISKPQAAAPYHTSTWTLGLLNLILVLGFIALGSALWKALRRRRPRHEYELAPLSEETADDTLSTVSSGIDEGYKNWGHD